MSDTLVLTHTENGRVAHLTLNRPDRLNAVDLATMHRLGETIEQLDAEATIGALVITGTGAAFCSGADLPSEGPIRRGPDRSIVMMDAARRVIEAIIAAPFPVIAAVNGPAAGVGASIAFACDLAIAAPEAYFFLPFTGIGLIPDGGATTTVAASIGRARAMRMTLLNEKLSADDALAAGLIAFVHPSAEFSEQVARTAKRLAHGSTPALKAAKNAVNRATLGGHGTLPEAIEHETQVQCGLLDTPDYEEGVLAFRERRRPAFPSTGSPRDSTELDSTGPHTTDPGSTDPHSPGSHSPDSGGGAQG